MQVRVEEREGLRILTLGRSPARLLTKRMGRALSAGLVFLAALLPSVASGKVTPAQKCELAKLRAAFKRAARGGNCYVRAAAQGLAVDPDCLARAAAAFTRDFQKAEDAGGCLTSGDAPRTAEVIDQCAAALANAFPTGNRTCRMDSDCRLFASYCSTAPCGCIPLLATDPDPVCGGSAVLCLVYPCGGRSASCAAGRCTGH